MTARRDVAAAGVEGPRARPGARVARTNRGTKTGARHAEALTAQSIGLAAWRTATSMRTALALMLVLGGLGLIATVVQQAPAGLSRDERAAWLASPTKAYGSWAPVFDALGLYDVFSSIWFRAAVVALVASILACSANRLRSTWHVAFHSPRTAPPGFFLHAAHAAETVTELPPAESAAAVRAVLRRRHYRTVLTERVDAIGVFADRFRLAPFGSLLIHLSLVAILVGAFVGASWGFRNSSFIVPVGSRVDVGHGTGLTVEAVEFTDSYYVDGSPSDYATDLVVYRDGARVAAQRVRVNEPLRYGEVSVYQSFFGPAIVLQARADGRVVFEGGVPLVWTSRDGLHSIGQFTLDDAGLTVYVGAVASGQVDPQLKAGQLQVEVYRRSDDTTPLDTAVLSQGAPATVGGVELTFVRERQYSGLIVASDPGIRFIWAGAALLMAGIVVVFLFRPRRLWVRIERSESATRVSLAAAASRDAAIATEFAGLAAEVAAELSGAVHDRR